MKRVVSVSLGSSKRNHKVETDFLGQPFIVERIGTDGDKRKAVELIRSLDGQVDAFGMGGTDLYIYVGQKRYTFRESVQIAAAAQKTPIVDGSGLKNTLERLVVNYLGQHDCPVRGKNVLLVSAVDRFGMAESLVDQGANVVFGDLMFGLGIPLPVRTLTALGRLAAVVAPVITKLPVSWVYPTGKHQEEIKPRFEKFYQWADMIAGDYHLIKKHMPAELPGKTILTNTVTKEDADLLRRRGVARLITTTPELQGRSFGTNVMEAVFISILGKHPEQIRPDDYIQLLHRLNFQPRIENWHS